MASLRAYIGAWMVRRRVKAPLAGAKSIDDVRRILGGASFPDPRDATFEVGSLGGVPGEWIRPVSGKASRRLFYVHGGGFVACSPRTHRPVTGAFARRGFEVFAPDYRLAPEHPFPAGLDDVIAAWSAFRAAGPRASRANRRGATSPWRSCWRRGTGACPSPRRPACSPPSPTSPPSTARASRTEAGMPCSTPNPSRRWHRLCRRGRSAHAPRLAGLWRPDRPAAAAVPCRRPRDPARRRRADGRPGQGGGGRDAAADFPVVAHAWQFADQVLPEAKIPSTRRPSS